jgi:hypothetical protein
VSEPLRIGLRALGVLLLLGGVGMLVALVVPGPEEVAGWMGQSCSRGTGFRESETCTVGDVLEVALSAPLMILVGFVLAIALRPPGAGPFTLDLSRGR